MDVSSIMTTTVVTVKPDATVGDALRLLDDQFIRHLPVVEGARLVGVISDRDLREYRLPLMEEVDHPDRADALMNTPVSEVMNTTLVTLEPTETLRTAIDLILEYGIGALPVVDRDTEELVGIVSYVDILKELREDLDVD